MTLFQKLILAFTAVLVAINIYYESGFRTPDRLLNKSTWTKFSNSEEWIKAGDFEFKPFLVSVSPAFSEGKIGLQFVYDVETRYLRNDTLHLAEVAGFREFSKDKVWWLNKDKDGIHRIKNIITLDDRNEFYNDKMPEYAFLNKTKLSFITSVFPSKVVNIAINSHDSLAIRLNPLLIFQNDAAEIFYWLTALLLVMYLMASGRAAYVFPMLILGISGFGGLDLDLWLFLAFMFVFSVLISIKLESIVFESLIGLSVDRPVLFKALAVMVYLGIVCYMFDWRWPSEFSFALLLPFVFALFIVFGLYLLSFLVLNMFFTLYFYFKYKKQVVSSISFDHLKSNLDKDSKETGKRLPMFYCDVLLNKTIKINQACINVFMFKKLKKGKPVSVEYFKTDGKGNYLFL